MTLTATSPAPTRSTLGALSGATAMVFVGGSVAVSAELADAPLSTLQAVRYAAAFVLLAALARLTGRPVRRPRGAEWGWLLGVTAAGLVLFNVALVHGGRHAEPAVLGVAVACVPVLLALLGTLLEGRPPTTVVLVAAGLVTVGAALVQGLGRADATGLVWATVVLACEAGFTLLALPVLRTHGPWGVSVHSTWLAALLFAVLGAVTEGPAAVIRLTADHWLAVGYLAVGVTAVAFVLWYSAVGRLGAGRAGLLTGIAPAAAALVGVVLGAPAPGPLVWLGIAVLGAGLGLGRGAGRPLRRPVAVPPLATTS